jgi:serine/threonine protein kinase
MSEPLAHAPSAPTEGQTIDDFLIMHQIGSGAFAQVHLAQHVPTGNFAAVKIVDLSKLNESETKSVVHEISVFFW